MTKLARQFAWIFFVGFATFAVAIGFGQLSGNVFSDNPALFALRYLGGGMMAAGIALWISARRDEAGKPALSTLIGMLVLLSLVLLVGAAIFTKAAQYASPMGLGFAVSAMVVGILAMLVSPAFPQPLTATWPGPAAPGTLLEPHSDHEPEAAAPPTPDSQADDLTRIEGIGPKIQSILNEAGIITYAALAGKTTETLSEILKGAGFSAPANPATWPEQSALAAKGDWDTLQTLADSLKGGRVVS